MHSLRQGAGIGYSSPSIIPQGGQPAHKPREFNDHKYPELAQIVKEMNTPLESGENVPHPPFNNNPRVFSPPPYEHATDRGLTDVKRPVSEGDLETDSTRKKFTDNSSSDSGGSSSDDEDSETDEKVPWPINDKNYLMGVIEDLQREQEEIRRKQLLHEQHIKELLEREPCVHKSFQSIRRTMSRDSEYSDKKMSRTPSSSPPYINQQMQQLLLTDEKLYVQLEQLYTNFHVIHFPNKTLQNIFGESRNPTPTYYDVNSTSEMRKLREENSSLQKKVKALEAKIIMKEREERRAAPPPPHLMPPGEPCLRSARSEGRLDQIDQSRSPTVQRRHNVGKGAGSRPNLVAGTPARQIFVAGRPMSPLPIPVMPKDLCPMEATFRWTISEYYSKLAQHRQLEGHREISSPFYLTHCGYRAQMEAYLNGNGTGTDKCMSIFLRVIKGDYDRHLNWPVNLHMDVILVNQSGNNSDSLKAGGNQFQYSKPCGTSDSESDCWGLIEFVSHEMIRQRYYIHNDKIVLKCKIQLLS